MSKSKKKNLKVRDLKPKKDAKGGGAVTGAVTGTPNTGAVTGTPNTGALTGNPNTGSFN